MTKTAAKQQDPPGIEGEMRPKPDHGEQSYRGGGNLEGKAAIITGADVGIGYFAAKEEEDARETARWTSRDRAVVCLSRVERRPVLHRRGVGRRARELRAE